MRLTSAQIQENYAQAVAQYQNPAPSQPAVITPLRSYSARQVRVYNDNEIKMLAPSVFADRPWSDTSENYRFLPTISVINALRDIGYNVTKASQSRSRMVIRDNNGHIIEAKRDFTKHMVRLRHNNYLNPVNVGDEVPEIVLINSHDRTSSYKLMLGFFRLVCSNGLIVASATIDSLNIRHSGRDKDLLQQVIDVSGEVVNEAPKAISQIDTFKRIELNEDEQKAFARSALEALDTTLDIEPARVLQHRRYDDQGNTLWKVSNRVQENLIKGGVYGKAQLGTFRRTREVKSIDSNMSINRAIWRLTEEMAKLKG